MPRPRKQHLKPRPDGRFACRYKSLWFYGKTEEEALQARQEYKEQEKQGRQQILFSAYAMDWLKAYKSHISPGPYNTYARILTQWIDYAGDRPIESYTPMDISGFYQTFSGMSYSTIHKVRITLRAVFRSALSDGHILRDPAANVAPPKGQKGTHRAITPEERDYIHRTDHRLRGASLAMLYAGLRRGEVLALNIDRDVDFKRKTITVREAVRFEDGQPIIVSPKTQAGIRTIPMLDILADELKGKHGLLCPSAAGKLMTESAWDCAWESYVIALGNTKNGCTKRWAKSPWQPVNIRAHDLRHSYCTMLYDANVDLKSAMLWMGHADQAMTMRIYTHLSDQRRTKAEADLRDAEKRMFGSQNGSQKSDYRP